MEHIKQVDASSSFGPQRGSYAGRYEQDQNYDKYHQDDSMVNSVRHIASRITQCY